MSEASRPDEAERATPLVTLADYDAVQTVQQALQLERRVLAQRQRITVEHRDYAATKCFAGHRSPWTHVLALDVGYARHCNATVAAGVLYHIATATVVARCSQHAISRFAYQPGLLAFREVPVLARVAEALLVGFDTSPKPATSLLASASEGQKSVLLLCDGHGTLHPRRCGVACHLGILLDRPSIGVGKSYFVGDVAAVATPHATPLVAPSLSKTSAEPPAARTFARLCALLDEKRGARLALHIDDGDKDAAGYMMRTQAGVRPLFVSAGHRITQHDACDTVLQLCHAFRQPEPMRHADHLGRVEVRRIERGLTDSHSAIATTTTTTTTTAAAAAHLP